MLLYIDPGSTSYIVQIVIGALLGTLFFFKSAWLQVKSWFQLIFNLFRKQK